MRRSICDQKLLCRVSQIEDKLADCCDTPRGGCDTQLKTYASNSYPAVQVDNGLIAPHATASSAQSQTVIYYEPSPYNVILNVLTPSLKQYIDSISCWKGNSSCTPDLTAGSVYFNTLFQGVSVPAGEDVFVGVLCDNVFKVSLNGEVLVYSPNLPPVISSPTTAFKYYWIMKIPKEKILLGDNLLEVVGSDQGTDQVVAATIWVDTESAFKTKLSSGDINIVNTVKIWDTSDDFCGNNITYSCPNGGTPTGDTCVIDGEENSIFAPGELVTAKVFINTNNNNITYYIYHDGVLLATVPDTGVYSFDYTAQDSAGSTDIVVEGFVDGVLVCRTVKTVHVYESAPNTGVLNYIFATEAEMNSFTSANEGDFATVTESGEAVLYYWSNGQWNPYAGQAPSPMHYMFATDVDLNNFTSANMGDFGSVNDGVSNNLYTWDGVQWVEYTDNEGVWHDVFTSEEARDSWTTAREHDFATVVYTSDSTSLINTPYVDFTPVSDIGDYSQYAGFQPQTKYYKGAYKDFAFLGFSNLSADIVTRDGGVTFTTNPFYPMVYERPGRMVHVDASGYLYFYEHQIKQDIIYLYRYNIESEGARELVVQYPSWESGLGGTTDVTFLIEDGIILRMLVRKLPVEADSYIRLDLRTSADYNTPQLSVDFKAPQDYLIQYSDYRMVYLKDLNKVFIFGVQLESATDSISCVLGYDYNTNTWSTDIVGQGPISNTTHTDGAYKWNNKYYLSWNFNEAVALNSGIYEVDATTGVYSNIFPADVTSFTTRDNIAYTSIVSGGEEAIYNSDLSFSPLIKVGNRPNRGVELLLSSTGKVYKFGEGVVNPQNPPEVLSLGVNVSSADIVRLFTKKWGQWLAYTDLQGGNTVKGTFSNSDLIAGEYTINHGIASSAGVYTHTYITSRVSDRQILDVKWVDGATTVVVETPLLEPVEFLIILY